MLYHGEAITVSATRSVIEIEHTCVNVKSQKFINDEEFLADGPKYQLRSGSRPRNETYIDLLPPIIPASVSIGWTKFYNKMLRQKAQFNTLDFERKPTVKADSSPMDVRGKIQAEMKLVGIMIPAEFLIIDRLGYDVIIGQDISETTKATIHTHTRTLSSYEGLINIPMTHSGALEFIKRCLQ